MSNAQKNVARTLTDDQFYALFARLEPQINAVQTPALIFDTATIEHHAAILKQISDRTGCSVLFAIKSFANYQLFPYISKYVSGSCVTSVNEMKLAAETFPGEIHAYRPAFSPDKISAYLEHTDHMVVNSFSQWQCLRPALDSHLRGNDGVSDCGNDAIVTLRHSCEGRNPAISVGIRINPEISAISDDNLQSLYNPCSPGSRLGVTKARFDKAYDAGEFEGLEGLHVHALCGSSAEDLALVVKSIEQNYGHVLQRKDVTWLNLGGGHAFSVLGYNINLLCDTIMRLQSTYNVKVYLEPGEFVTTDSGVYITTVDDVIETEMGMIGVIDGSADAHMHDSTHMPFRYPILGAVDPDEDDYDAEAYPYVYRFGGNTCMCGDNVYGRYAFAKPLVAGDKLIFWSFAEYTTVLFSTFNGVPWPNYYQLDPSGDLTVLRLSRYEDYKDRLGD